MAHGERSIAADQDRAAAENEYPRAPDAGTAHAPEPLRGFDEYVGAYEELGIGEVSSFLPPFYHDDAEPVPPATVAIFERIGSGR